MTRRLLRAPLDIAIWLAMWALLLAAVVASAAALLVLALLNWPRGRGPWRSATPS